MRLGNHFLTPITLDVWRSVHELGYSNESSSKNKEPSTSSTIDAIKEVRSKRPMSRMEVPSDISSKDEHGENEACLFHLSPLFFFVP